MPHLENKPMADTQARMGRPPLGVKPTTVRLSLETLTRIVAVAGKNRVAIFIRDAVEHELRRRERPPKQ